LQSPVIQSGEETWAPSGATFLKGSLFFAGLRGQSLFELVISDSKVNLKRHLQRKFGRLRDVIVGPDGFLYLLTSNRDGRGFPTSDDDQMIKINPEKL
jgi:glucose/arabinose dehydrogenase